MNNTRTPTCRFALRVEAVILNPAGETNHHIKFDFADLGQRWAFIERIEHCLQNGYTVGLQKVDPKIERLTQRYPVHG